MSLNEPLPMRTVSNKCVLCPKPPIPDGGLCRACIDLIHKLDKKKENNNEKVS